MKEIHTIISLIPFLGAILTDLNDEDTDRALGILLDLCVLIFDEAEKRDPQDCLPSHLEQVWGRQAVSWHRMQTLDAAFDATPWEDMQWLDDQLVYIWDYDPQICGPYCDDCHHCEMGDPDMIVLAYAQAVYRWYVEREGSPCWLDFLGEVEQREDVVIKDPNDYDPFGSLEALEPSRTVVASSEPSEPIKPIWAISTLEREVQRTRASGCYLWSDCQRDLERDEARQWYSGGDEP